MLPCNEERKPVEDKYAANLRNLTELHLEEDAAKTRTVFARKNENDLYSMFSDSPRTEIGSFHALGSDPDFVNALVQFAKEIKDSNDVKNPAESVKRSKQALEKCQKKLDQISSRGNSPWTTVSSPAFEVGSSSGLAQGRPSSVPIWVSPGRLGRPQNFGDAPLALAPLSHRGSPGSDSGVQSEGLSSLRRTRSLEFPGARMPSPRHSPKRDEQGRLIFQSHYHPEI